MAELVSLTEISAAAERLRPVAVRTSLIPFRVYPGEPGGVAGPGAADSPAVFVKPESLQPTGAFKLRGAYNAISVLLAGADPGSRPAGVVAHSSGNHGFAVGYAAALLGLPAAIVVPDSAPRVKTDLIRGTGAELVTVAPTMAARVEGSRQIARTRGYAEVAPFDDRSVIAGQGTIGLEIAEDVGTWPEPPSAVLVPVGGGGLVSGVAVAVKALLPATRVVGVEPEFAADARQSLHTGTRVRLTSAETARTRADSLRVEQIGELTFPHIRRFVDDIVTVSEDEITQAVRWLALGGHLVAEPGGAVAVAAAMFRGPAGLGLAHGGAAAPVIAVVSGGNIDPALLAEILGG